MIRRAVGILAMLATIASLSPTVAAIFDHHAPERLADHGHVYYGRPDLDHRHGYESTHVEIAAAGPAQTSVRSVVIVPSSSAATELLVLALAPGYASEIGGVVPAPPSSSRIASMPDARPRTVILRPPFTPPRAHA